MELRCGKVQSMKRVVAHIEWRFHSWGRENSETLNNRTKMNIKFAFSGNFQQRFPIFARLPTARPLSYMISLPINTASISFFHVLDSHSFAAFFPILFSFFFYVLFIKLLKAFLFSVFLSRLFVLWVCSKQWQGIQQLPNATNRMWALIVSPDSNDQWA